jgi:hypothetical protein
MDNSISCLPWADSCGKKSLANSWVFRRQRTPLKGEELTGRKSLKKRR